MTYSKTLRRRRLRSNPRSFIGSAFMQTFADGSKGLMMGGRFLGGFAIGISSLVIPVYLSEFSPPHIRGRLVGMYDMGIQAGTLCGFWINFGLVKNVAPSKVRHCSLASLCSLSSL